MGEPDLNAIPTLRDRLHLDLFLYSWSDGKAIPHFRPLKSKYKDFLLILTPSPTDISSPALICNPKLCEFLHICEKRDDCRYQSRKRSNFDRHSAKCDQIATQIMTPKQVKMGNDSSFISELVGLNYLPESAKSYRTENFCGFDIALV